MEASMLFLNPSSSVLSPANFITPKTNTKNATAIEQRMQALFVTPCPTYLILIVINPIALGLVVEYWGGSFTRSWLWAELPVVFKIIMHGSYLVYYIYTLNT